MVTAASNFGFLLQLIGSGGTPAIQVGAGDPEGAQVGNLGDLWLRTDGGAGNSLYLKQANPGGTQGWVSAGPILFADLSSQVDGIASVFTLGAKATQLPSVGLLADVQLNGQGQREGAADDYIFSESVPGAGYDTLSFNFVPELGDVLLVRYLAR